MTIERSPQEMADEIAGVHLHPFEDDEDDNEHRCPQCDRTLGVDTECAYLKGIPDRSDGYYCDSCTRALLLEAARDAVDVARDECKLTGRLHRFDPAHRSAPTREQYEAGDREAYTENSVRAYNRHDRTNYDALIAELDRDNAIDRIFYNAIRDRIDVLLDEAELDDEKWEPEENVESLSVDMTN
jgi:hypothetical protein